MKSFLIYMPFHFNSGLIYAETAIIRLRDRILSQSYYLQDRSGRIVPYFVLRQVNCNALQYPSSA